VTGDRYNRAIMFRRPAIIERVDDQGAFVSNPIRIVPGTRRLVLGAPMPDWPGGSDLQVFTLDAQPCQRYYINAQFQNNVLREWSPVIDYVEGIAGCTVEPKK
jgi:hypothetical protein